MDIRAVNVFDTRFSNEETGGRMISEPFNIVCLPYDQLVGYTIRRSFLKAAEEIRMTIDFSVDADYNGINCRFVPNIIKGIDLLLADENFIGTVNNKYAEKYPILGFIPVIKLNDHELSARPDRLTEIAGRLEVVSQHIYAPFMDDTREPELARLYLHALQKAGRGEEGRNTGIAFRQALTEIDTAQGGLPKISGQRLITIQPAVQRVAQL